MTYVAADKPSLLRSQKWGGKNTQFNETQGFKLDMVAHSYNLSIWEVEAGKSRSSSAK